MVNIIAARSVNFQLLVALRKTLAPLGIQDDTDWNDSHEPGNRLDCDHLVINVDSRRALMSYHNHNADAQRVYDLPAQWDEFVVAAKKLAKVEKPISLAGYEMKVDADGAHFGCQCFARPQVEGLRDFLSRPISAKLTISGTEVTVELLDMILERITNAWKVGSLLSSKALSKPGVNIYREGTGDGWSNTMGYFDGDRVIKEIKDIDGKTCALISDTWGLWVELASL